MIEIPQMGREDLWQTGFTEEDLAATEGGRTLIDEFKQDYSLFGDCLKITAHDLEAAIEQFESSLGRKPNEEERNIIAALRSGLISITKRWTEMGEQGDLFDSISETPEGQNVSLKQEEMNRLEAELREWFNLVAGFKNVFSKVTHDFESIYELGDSIKRPDSEKTQWYSRGFDESIQRYETTFAAEFGLADVVVLNSGMSAIEACFSALELREGDVVLVGQEFYLQTPKIFADYAKRGAKIITVDTNNLEGLEQAISENKPRAVFLESIENDTPMGTADLGKLITINSQWNSTHPEQPCRLILDNTFASLGLMDLQEKVRASGLADVQWAVTESATKYYQQGMDNITAGLVYSDDPEFMQGVRDRRKLIGTHLQAKLGSYLPAPDVELLEHRMMRHSMNALYLASALERAGLKVSYPGLQSHPHHQEANSGFEVGVGGVFYIACDNADGNPQQFLNMVRAEARELGVGFKLGVSFGHPETWAETIPPSLGEDWHANDTRQWEVRVMAGGENVAEIKKIAESFERALKKTETSRKI